MYSGSDSTESQNVTQWALNPQAYQNMSNDQVDWAALAQQWIIMKEAGPPPMPDPQKLSKKKKARAADNLNEGGEAPMDMDTEKDEVTPTWNANTVEPGTQPQPPGMESWGWNSQQQQNWAWNNSWTAPPATVPPPPNKSALLPTPPNYNQFNAPVESSSDNATFGGYTSGQVNDYSSGYWTSPKVTQLKPHNRKYSKVNVPVVNKPLPPAMVPAAPVNTLTLDAAKRKTLPAWIREGLEKMERDKQKQLEKERTKLGKEDSSEKIKLDEKETMEILKSTINERNKSKFESDGEYSDEEKERKKRRVESPDPVPLTHDELMLKVRRTMTEILLKVTNREIESICREELQRHLKRSKASDQRVSAPSGANVTAKLGVGMYGGDSGSSSSDVSDDDSRQGRKDSDSDLKDSIKRKRVDFLRTEREIDDRLALAERRRVGNDSRSSSPDTNDNDSQVDAKHQARKPRTNNSSDRTPPHSKSDRQYSKRLPSDSDNSDSDHGRSRNSRRSSSSESDARSKRRSKSRSRSRSSDKKYKKKASRRSRTKSPVRRRYSRSSSRTPRRDSNGSRSRRRSRSRSYSRTQRSRSSSYKRSKGSDSRGRNRRSRSKSRNSRRSRTKSPYVKSGRRSRSRSEGKRSHRRRSRSSSSGRGKRSYRR